MPSRSSTRRVLVVGAGQLGQALVKTVSSHIDLVQVNRNGLDLTVPETIEKSIQDYVPEVVVNAAAYTAVDKAETDAETAFLVNEQGVRLLCEACLKSGARLIHVSTDYVFSGDQGEHLSVDAPTNPQSVYGKSKLAGEQAIADFPTLGSAVVRTAWVYSNWGSNFVNTMLRLMAERESLSVVSDQVGSPTSAWTLARAIWCMVEQPELAGTFHWTDAGVASWYDFALAIQEEAFELGLLNRTIPVRPILTKDYPTPAKRPACSLLDKSKLWQSIELAPLHWREALREVLKLRLDSKV